MPSLQVIVTIDDFRKLPRQKRPNLADRSYSFEADCQACGKYLGDGDWKNLNKFRFGVARTADGTLWDSSRGPWIKSRDFFDTEEKSAAWVFRQEQLYGAENTYYACSKSCSTQLEAEFCERMKEIKEPEQDVTCDHCGKPNPSKRCGNCKVAIYCSRDCQKSAWRKHSKECSSNQKAQQQKTGSSKKEVPTQSTQKSKSPEKPPAPEAKTSSSKSTPKATTENMMLCSGCKKSYPKSSYSNKQLKAKGKRKCSDCLQKNTSTKPQPTVASPGLASESLMNELD